MANNFDSNFNTKLAKIIIPAFDSYRTLSRNVDTQLLTGRFGPDSGETVEFKRPTDYTSVRTSTGDVSGETKSSIVNGKATGTVQDYFTVFVDYDEADQALKMDQEKELVEMPMIRRIVTDLELDFASFMMKNSALLSGTVGTAADSWSDIAKAGAVMNSHGIPMDAPMYYTVNPYTQTKLAENTVSLGAGGSAGKLVSEAYKKASIRSNYAGFDDVMTATTLASFTTDSAADRAGTLKAAPTPTYAAAKDTMQQSWSLTGLDAVLEIKAGDTIVVTGRNRLNLNTRQPIIDDAGANVPFSAVVLADVTCIGGEAVVTVSGPAIYEATGAYNTVDSALAIGDVITIQGAASTILQPNLFWHKQAFSIGSVPIKKLYSTDTIATTKDGLQMRISKGVDFLGNEQKIRIDFRPAYSVLNPFFAGHGWGN